MGCAAVFILALFFCRALMELLLSFYTDHLSKVIQTEQLVIAVKVFALGLPQEMHNTYSVIDLLPLLI